MTNYIYLTNKYSFLQNVGFEELATFLGEFNITESFKSRYCVEGCKGYIKDSCKEDSKLINDGYKSSFNCPMNNCDYIKWWLDSPMKKYQLNIMLLKMET